MGQIKKFGGQSPAAHPHKIFVENTAYWSTLQLALWNQVEWLIAILSNLSIMWQFGHGTQRVELIQLDICRSV
jgi:hypothetical protein